MQLPRLLALLALLTLTGLARAADAPGGKLEEVAGTEWRLQTMTADGKAVELAKGSTATLKIERAGGVSGAATVNRFFGGVKQDAEGKLSWGALGATRMAGPEPLMQQESAYLGALTKTTRLEKREGVLVLQSADGKTVLEFAAAK